MRIITQAQPTDHYNSTEATELLKQLDQKFQTECPLLGQRVVTTGTSREHLNGRTGVAITFDHARGRYVVELTAGEVRTRSSS